MGIKMYGEPALRMHSNPMASCFDCKREARFHHVAAGQAHEHLRFCAKSHEGHRVIAVCGKGGVGKTAFSALVLGAMVRSGVFGRILVVDADPALGLGLALGVPVGKTIGFVREEILRTAGSKDLQLEAELAGKLDYLIAESLTEADGYAFMAMGHSDSLGCYCSVNDLLRDAIQVLIADFDTVLIDGEAGLEQINRQVVAGIDRLIVLSDGSCRGMNTVNLIYDIAKREHLVEAERIGVVFNRVLAGIDEAQPLPKEMSLLGIVPLDPVVARCDAQGIPLDRLSPDTPAAHSVWHIVEGLF